MSAGSRPVWRRNAASGRGDCLHLGSQRGESIRVGSVHLEVSAGAVDQLRYNEIMLPSHDRTRFGRSWKMLRLMASDKKYQVFVSSTFVDLKEERQDLIKHILDLKHIPAGMELFPAADVDQLEYIKKIIDQCDYYVLIMGGRYGSMDAGGVSYTEREYDYAVQTGKVVLAFVHDDVGSIASKFTETNHAAKLALDVFREKVKLGRLVSPWKDRQGLELAVIKALMHAFNDFPMVGWVRADAPASSEVLQQSNDLLRENAELRAKIIKLEAQPLVAISDLAGLDDLFKFKFTYYNANRAGSSYPESDMSLTWRQIFLGVAGHLEKAKTDGVIASGVKDAAKENAGRKIYSLVKTDQVRIKVQLEALGLIGSKVAETTQGGVAEFLHLTDYGRSVFIQSTVIRASKPADTDETNIVPG
jgi:hypothetical protein